MRLGRGVRHKPGEMNHLETAYAHKLEAEKLAGRILWYAFESIKFKLAPATFYNPDFLVMIENGELEIHETKGTRKGKPFAEDDAMVKLKVVAEKFPLFRFKMIWRVGSEWNERIINGRKD